MEMSVMAITRGVRDVAIMTSIEAPWPPHIGHLRGRT
jgi:hypothetical protein